MSTAEDMRLLLREHYRNYRSYAAENGLELLTGSLSLVEERPLLFGAVRARLSRR